MSDLSEHLRALRHELEEAAGDLRRVTAEADRILESGEVPDVIDRAIIAATFADAVHRGDRAKVAVAVLRS